MKEQDNILLEFLKSKAADSEEYWEVSMERGIYIFDNLINDVIVTVSGNLITLKHSDDDPLQFTDDEIYDLLVESQIKQREEKEKISRYLDRLIPSRINDNDDDPPPFGHY